jgi:hypothetical protein
MKDKILPRIFLANVGVNASHIGMGLQSPLFPDGRFEFMPIPELPQFQNRTGFLRYRDLSCWNETNLPLARYIPESRHELAVHHDPDFTVMTYGDECGRTPRAAALKQVQPGDFIVFLARLAIYRDGRFTGQAGFYLIGFLEVAEILENVRNLPDGQVLERYRNNAHMQRAISEPGWFDGFYIFAGSDRSRRFALAKPFGRTEAEHYLRDKNGLVWNWKEGRSDLQTVGSYTRTCRCVLNPERSPEEAERTMIFIRNMLSA